MNPNAAALALRKNRELQALLVTSIEALDASIAQTNGAVRTLEASLLPADAPGQGGVKRKVVAGFLVDPVSGASPPPCRVAKARQEVALAVASSVSPPSEEEAAVAAAAPRGSKLAAESRPPWTADEERELVVAAAAHSYRDWRRIAEAASAASGRPLRTPLEAFRHYQRSLNPSHSRGDWTAEDDDALRRAVEVHGTRNNWQLVADCLEGRGESRRVGSC